jgi:hypothetical protein
MKKEKNVVKKNVVNDAVVINKELQEKIDRSNLALNSYCMVETKRSLLSCASQLTKELTIKELSLNEIVSFCQSFYARVPNSNCIWLCEEKNAESTFKKHIAWLSKKDIHIDKNGAKYFINHSKHFSK